MKLNCRISKFFLSVSLLLLLASCANELSDEVKNREISDREYSRLSEAEGNYVGYMEGPAPKKGRVPVNVIVTVRKNPTDNKEQPILEGTLRIGFFGGVTIGSSSGFYDFGKKSLVLSFGKAQAGASSPTSTAPTPGGGTPSSSPSTLEFRATVDNGNLVDPVFIGANTGTHSLVLSKTGASLFFGKAQDDYLLYFSDSKGTMPTQYSGILNLKQINAPQMAPSTADLPLFPGMNASVTFETMGVRPQVARLVLYDPIQGTLDMNFTDSSWVMMKDFFIVPDGITAKNPSEFAGQVVLGGDKKNIVRATSVEHAPDVGRLPPPTFVGTYSIGPDVIYKSVAYLDYGGSSGTNSSELPFLKFPSLKLQLLICTDDDTQGSSTLFLDSLDYLKKVAVFRRPDSTYDPLELHWDRGWQNLSGSFLGSSETPGGDKPKVKWLVRNSDPFQGCKEAPVPGSGVLD